MPFKYLSILLTAIQWIFERYSKNLLDWFTAKDRSGPERIDATMKRALLSIINFSFCLSLLNLQQMQRFRRTCIFLNNFSSFSWLGYSHQIGKDGFCTPQQNVLSFDNDGKLPPFFLNSSGVSSLQTILRPIYFR